MSQSKDQFVLFVPHWVTRVLDREKLAYNKLLNLNELRNHFSTEELSILYWLNRDHPLFRLPTNADGLVMQDGMTNSIWTNYPEDTEYVFTRLRPMEEIAKQAIEARLSPTEQSASDTGDKFKILALSESKLVLLVIVYPGVDKAQLTAMSNALLKQLYAHTGYDDMARNHLFRSYIERLALANNAL